ncbi:hypothetical protein F4V43_09560 [Paenibacillus spiritus]|uniref:Uncharacterized protein n=1 Tax=Paenibacillus spiritus TaxID=2496557 RepID=A0A5J5G9L1_9BACL|nr:hypothetical protein [Paenibacillus spiritus]KAA9004869.1 hypothetical protein F4V43_09560 [Paenibacillus spiritus]
MTWYQVIEICNEEPLKIGSGGSKAHWDEPCKDYIPGSTLRGGAIARLRKMGLFDDDSKAILQDMECLNAYLYQEGQLYTPAPQHLRMDKHHYRRESKWADRNERSGLLPLIDLYSLKEADIRDTEEDQPKNQLPLPYVSLHERYMKGVAPRKSYRLHHSSLLNSDLRERANLFSYQALESGYVFRSIIAYSENIKGRIETMWDGMDVWYLGGAKGSGYGRCRVQPVGDPLSDYAQAKEVIGLPALSYDTIASEQAAVITLTCLSDLIIRGPYGEPRSCLPEEYLEEISGLKFKASSRHFIQTGVTEGYNATWKARYPKETTIKAGSIMRYELEGWPDSSTLSRAMKCLEQQRYGARPQDGYGWIAVNLPYPANLLIEPEALKEDTRKSFDSDGAQEVHKSPTSAPYIAESIRIISKGLSDNRFIWLRELRDKLMKSSDSPEALTLNGLKAHHCRVMLNLLEGWLRSGDKPASSVPDEQAVSRQTYREDKERFSLAGVHFNGIMKFLGEGYSSPEYEALRKLADNKLSSNHGEIYYNGIGDSSMAKQKRLIAELLCQALYLQQRSAEEEAISNEYKTTFRLQSYS